MRAVSRIILDKLLFPRFFADFLGIMQCVRAYIRLFFTAGVHSGFLGAANTAFPATHRLPIHTDNVMAIEGIPGFTG
jgi:hypothetical protein